jgi:hypothetical protein
MDVRSEESLELGPVELARRGETVVPFLGEVELAGFGEMDKEASHRFGIRWRWSEQIDLVPSDRIEHGLK